MIKKTKFARNQIDNFVKQGFKNANRSLDYDNGRPSYPNETVKFLVDHLQRKNEIIEVGAGTGIFTKKLLDNTKDFNMNFTIIDPVEQMVSYIEKNINFQEYPNVKHKIFIQKADQIPFEDDKIDGIFAAQCFHWFANLVTLKEFHRVLHKNGKLFLLWNSLDLTRDYMKELSKVDYKYNNEKSPTFESGEWRSIINNQNMFKLVNQKQFPNIQKLTIDKVLSRYLSISYISKFISQSEQNKEIVKNEFLNVLMNHKDLKGKTEVEIPHQTHAFIFEKI